MLAFSKLVVSKRLTANTLHMHLSGDVQWEYHDCMMLADKGYLSAEIRQNFFDAQTSFWKCLAG